MTSEQRRARPGWWRGVALVLFVVAGLAAGIIGAALQGPTEQVQARYEAFTLPAWAPPTWAFGVVWPILYIMIGLAAWRIWQASHHWREVSGPLTLWSSQLAVNAVWPWVFFGIERYGAGVAVIGTLDVLVASTIVVFARRDRLAAWLLVPYLLWLVYATALNTAVWLAN